ncbi:ATPase central domain containing protein [Nitzschia inconspicua]|uniref:ATPase central domain containing protein n=1 Tax=Nitzschia inconspicua TaxID=303405 RepID=A0A9K3LLJ4_9STRA|nr:ATPase central domain containing protein [Nitzschia inconspicua]
MTTETTRTRSSSCGGWHAEVSVRPTSASNLESIRNWWRNYFRSGQSESMDINREGEIDMSPLPQDIRGACIRATLTGDDSTFPVSFSSVSTRPCDVHVYVLSEEESCIEELQPTGGDDEWTAGCDNLSLPHTTLEGVWESLVFESEVKRQLLSHAQSALLFSDKRVSSHIIQWNRMILLHGPPGTGKTTLCRALAHKLAIRQCHRFPRTTLLEIHSHSLFSKWFSTSGKLVSALFQMIRDMVEDDPSSLVCVLIDEVESLAASRSNTSSNGDPTDAMRAVNSLLTSLDRLRHFPNVLVLATTNLNGSVDSAFVDRVDLKLHIGLPIAKARYQILRSCIQELIRVGIVHCSDNDTQGSDFPTYEEIHNQGEHKMDVSHSITEHYGVLLSKCAQQAEGLSGRSLRKLPLQAHALYTSSDSKLEDGSLPLEHFLEALFLAIENDVEARVGL